MQSTSAAPADESSFCQKIYCSADSVVDFSDFSTLCDIAEDPEAFGFVSVDVIKGRADAEVLITEAGGEIIHLHFTRANGFFQMHHMKFFQSKKDWEVSRVGHN